MKFKASLALCCLGLAPLALGTENLGASSSAFVSIFYPAANSNELSQLLDGIGGPLGTAEHVGFLVDSLLKSEEEVAKPKGLGDLSTSLTKLVDTLKAQVNKTHTESKKQLSASQRALEKCRGSDWKKSSGFVNSKAADDAEANYKGMKKNFTKCSKEKKPLEDEAGLCKTLLKSLKGVEKSSCDSFKTADTLPANMATTCTVSAADVNEASWVKRVKKYVKGELESLKGLKGTCDNATQKVQTKQGECDVQQGKLDNKTKECGAPAGVLQAKCMWLSAVQLMCKTYTECYDRQAKAYNSLMGATRQGVVSRKLQWRMLMRLTCLAGAFDSQAGKVDKAKLDACAAQGAYKADHLDIEFQEMAKGICNSKLPDNVPTADCKS